jgi:hypothetical protein
MFNLLITSIANQDRCSLIFVYLYGTHLLDIVKNFKKQNFYIYTLEFNTFMTKVLYLDVKGVEQLTDH